MPFAQLVIGPPGSGKSTYCDGMQQLLAAVERKCSIVNLDPANDHTSYTAALDVRDLVSLEEVMEAEELGPNGGVLYALEELEHNIEWLEEELQKLGDEYIIFDCPGQVELFTHHSSLRNIFFRLQKLGYRLVVLHLMDSFTLTQPSLYLSSLLLSLRAMLQMDLPHLNVLTKIDKLASYPPLPLPLDFYTDVQSLEYLLPHLQEEQARVSTTDRAARFKKLNEAIIELVEDFGLVSYTPLAVEDRSMMLNLLHEVDRAGGYVFVPSEPRLDGRGRGDGADQSVWSVVMRESAPGKLDVRDIEERWTGAHREEYDDLERNMWKVEGEVERKRVQGEAGRADEQEASSHLPDSPSKSSVAVAASKTSAGSNTGAGADVNPEQSIGTVKEETEEEEYDRLEAEAIAKAANAAPAGASASTGAKSTASSSTSRDSGIKVVRMTKK